MLFVFLKLKDAVRLLAMNILGVPAEKVSSLQ